MLFNLCLAIITITAHASPHYLTVWIHFAVHISQNTYVHTRQLRRATGRTTQDGKQNGKLCYGWPLTLSRISPARPASDSFWLLKLSCIYRVGSCSSYQSRKINGLRKIWQNEGCRLFGDTDFPVSGEDLIAVELIITWVFISASLQHANNCSCIHAEMNSKIFKLLAV